MKGGKVGTAPAKKKSPSKHSPPPKASGEHPGRAAASKGIEAACEKILTGLVELNIFSTTAHSKQRVAIAAGYKNVTTKTFRSAIAALRDRGDIECQPNQMIFLTEQGRDKAGSVACTPKSNGEMLEHIVELIKVPGYKQGCGKMVEALKCGAAKTRLQVANEMGLSRTDSQGFRKCLKSMKEHGMVEVVKDEYSNQELIQLSDFAFPQGRPDMYY